MSTGGESPLIGDITTLTARLDGLSADQNPEILSSTLKIAFTEHELYKRYIYSLAEDTERAKALLEVFDKALTAPKYDPKILKKFRQLCGRTGLLPASHIIPEKFIQTTELPVAYGGFGDVWEGIYNYKPVAIKALRVYKDNDVQEVRKIFCKEVVLWRYISHPNIVPFLGVSEAPAPLSMVSEWMPNGSVRDYVVKNRETSRLQLLLDISQGLSFLHSLDIVHGDLKGDNILVDKLGCARLCDFGFTCIVSLNCTETSAPKFKGSYRWMAPELYNIKNEDKSGLPTRGSDMFALGMVTFEVFTGQVPFPENETSTIVMKRITDGEKPSRPPKAKKLGLSDELWEIVQSSLAYEVEERPPVSTFVDFLGKAIPDIAVLEGLTEFDANSEDDIQELRHMFGYGDNTLLGMREKEILLLIEVFDRALNSSLNDPPLRSQCLRGLQRVSARCGLLPKSYWVSHSSLIQYDGVISVARKASSTCRRLMDGKLVAVRTINPDCIEDFNTFKRRLCSSAVMWKRLRHPNIVSFLGFSSASPPFLLVCPWMPNGNLSDYVRGNPDADKLALLSGVIHGLTFLHQYNMVHGNLTGRNVLVDSNAVACISYYGLDLVLRGEPSSKSTASVRWMAPEILLTENRRVTSVDEGKRADVYSFAMVTFEVLSGTIPFPDESPEEIAERVVRGNRPDWPSNNPSQALVDVVWDQVEPCWNQEPMVRPTAMKVLQALEEAHAQEPVISVEDAGDDAITSDWEHVDNVPEDPYLTRKGRKNHRNSNDLSGLTLVPFPLLSDSTLPHHSRSSSTRRIKNRLTRVEKRVRDFMHLPRHASTAEKPAPGAEIVDEREEEVSVREANVSYLVSRPIPKGKTLKKVVVTVISKDQGWSTYLEDYGTYRNSWTWFELSVGPPEGFEQKWRGIVVRNLHAHSDFKEHTIEMSDEKLYEEAEGGDVLTVWAHARFEGWKNTVKKVKIRYVVE